MYLRSEVRGSSEGNGAISKRGNFLWNGKITCEEASRDLLISCLSFRGGFEGSNEEKLGRQQKRRGSILRCGETLFEEDLWKFCGTRHVWRSSGNCLYQKVPLENKVGWDRVAYCSQRCQCLLLLLLSSWSHCYGLYWCMPRKKRRDGKEGH